MMPPKHDSIANSVNKAVAAGSVAGVVENGFSSCTG